MPKAKISEQNVAETLVAADNVLDQRREQGEGDGADDPEPRHDQHPVEEPRLGFEFAKQLVGREQRIAAHLDRRVGGCRLGHLARGQPAGDGHGDHRCADRLRGDVFRGRVAAGDGADDDGGESSALDQRIAGDQLARGQLLGQHAVLDWTEQRRQRSECGDGEKQQDDGMKREAEGGEAGGEDFGEFHPPGNDRLVVLVGEFSRQPRQKKEGRDERGAGELNERSRMAFGRHAAESDEDDEGLLEERIVHRCEELRPEQGREAP